MPKLVEESPLTYKLYNEDCFETLKRIPDDGVDLVLCDPPYGTTQCPWDSCIPLQPLWLELNRVCKGAKVFTSSNPFTAVLVSSNLTAYNHEWIWKKSKVTGVLNAKRQPLRHHENIVVFGRPIPYFPQGLVPVPVPVPVKQGSSSKNYGERGKYGYTQLMTGYPRTVLEIPSAGKTVHPTQKPVPLMEYLIRTYSQEGDTVLDFAMGSGTTGVACGNLGRNFIGCDNDTKHGYFEIASNRIKDAYNAQ